MMGVQQALRGVASVIGPIWAGFAYQSLGPRVPFFACAVIILCAALLATQVPRVEPVPVESLLAVYLITMRVALWLLSAALGLAPGKPRLVVVVTVDQCRADYLDHYRAQFLGGLRRLLRRARCSRTPFRTTP